MRANMALRLDRRGGGCRVYVKGHRLHHGLTGVILLGAGIGLMVHDRQDAPYWWRGDRLDPKAPWVNPRKATK